MKLKYLLFIALLYCNPFFLQAQVAPSIQWQKCYGGTGKEYGNKILPTNDGGYIIIGRAFSDNGDVIGHMGVDDVWLIKINSNGDIDWQKCVGGSRPDYSYSIEQANDSGYIFAGHTSSTDGDVTCGCGTLVGWVVKLTKTGVIQWQRCWCGDNNIVLNSVVKTRDGGYIIAGSSSSLAGELGGSQFFDAWLIKLDSSGNTQWKKKYGGTGGDSFQRAWQCDDGGFITAGASSSVNGDVISGYGSSDIWMVKADSMGNIQWQKKFGGSNAEFFGAFCQTSDRGFVFTGFTYSSDYDVSYNHGMDDAWIFKTDSLGNLLWEKSIGGSLRDRSYSVEQTTDGGYVIAGETESFNGDITGNHGQSDILVVKLDSAANIEWKKYLGGSDKEGLSFIHQLNAYEYILTGYSYSANGDAAGNHGGSDAWVVKLGPVTVPLMLVSLTAQKQNKSILLNWQTQTEINTKHFIVEKSANTNDFKLINTITASGNSSTTKNYSCIDASPFSGTNYYRLKEVDKDGSFVYSKTVAVNFSGKESIVYPNPASSVITIVPSGLLKSIAIIDAAGKLIQQLKPTANHQYSISQLLKGLYSLKLLYQDSEEVIQLQKQ